MSNFKEQLDFASGVIQTAIKGLGAQPPLADRLGQSYGDLDSVQRYALFRRLICQQADSTLTHSGIRCANPHFSAIANGLETGIDVATHFIRVGSATLRASTPRITLAESKAALIDSYGVIQALQNTDDSNAYYMEDAYGLNSMVKQNKSLRRFTVTPGPINRLALRHSDSQYLQMIPGSCPFLQAMPAVFAEMVDAAAKIDWLLPQDFATMEAAHA